MNAKSFRKPVMGLLACASLILHASALTPAGQADAFHARGVAAEARGDEQTAMNCFTLALRAQPGHAATLASVQKIEMKHVDASLARASAAARRGDLATANREYAAVLETIPDHPVATEKLAELKEKLFAPPADTTPSWTSKDGKTIQAAFIRLDGEAVVILAEGKETKVAFARLSADSVAQARAFGEISKDVLLHYDFSDGNGTTIADRSGNGRHGTLHGFADRNAGAGDTSPSGWTRSGSLRFDGADDYISTPLAVSDFGAGSFTLEAVVSHTNIGDNLSPIIASDAEQWGTPGAILLGKIHAGHWTSPPSGLAWRHTGLSVDLTDSKRPTSLCDGKLHHVALVRDAGTEEVRIYFDHLLHDRVPGVTGRLPANHRILIGTGVSDASERWTGPISEVRITKRALAPGQFLPNPNPLAATPPPPKHRWSFNGDVKDSIGSAHGTLIDPGQPTARFTGGQLDLSRNRGERSNATTDDAYVDLPNGIVAGLKGRASFEVWCQPANWHTYACIFRFERSIDGEGVSSTRRDNYAAIGLIPRNRVNDVISFLNLGSGEWIADSKMDLQLGEERHFILVLDPDDHFAGPGGTQTLYLDGYKLASSAMPPGFLDNYGDINNWLGRTLRDGPMFSGYYNELRFYDKALTADEVLASHLAGPDAVFGTPGK